MKKYQILEHKADLKIRAFGKTKEEVFLNMLKGMTSALWAKVKNQKVPLIHTAKIKNIKVKSLDLESLLVDFLSEILYLTQVNKEIYNNVKFKKFSDTELEAELMGKKIERFGEEIKAVTWHSLDVHQKEDGVWQATVLFDI